MDEKMEFNTMRYRYPLLAVLLLLLTGDVFAKEGLGSLKNPIRCDSPNGESWYLSRLRLQNGDDVDWSRGGSLGGGDGAILDVYKSSEGEELFLDMYHPRYVEIKAPNGYRILWEWSDDYEYIDGLICSIKDSKPFTGKVDLKRGKTRVVGEIENGLIKGKLSHYYESGKVKCVSMYKDNRLDGKELWYREDGKLWAFYHYKQGVPDGLYRYYDENGKLETEITYVEGVEVGDE